MSQPKIIKLSQTVWELWPAQDFGIRGDNYGESESTLEHNMPTGPYTKYQNISNHILKDLAYFFFFFLIWVLRPFQEYFTYIEPIVHRRWAKTGEPGEKPPDHP